MINMHLDLLDNIQKNKDVIVDAFGQNELENWSQHDIQYRKDFCSRSH